MGLATGIVLRGAGGFYDVRADQGDMIRCRPRGRMRLDNLAILAGDRVTYTRLDEGQGVIEEILPRKSVLTRPAVANIDQMIVVSACARPDPQLTLIDRLLVLAESNGIVPVLCLNKIDLVSGDVIEGLATIYEKAGYKVLKCSAKLGMGVDKLRQTLVGRVSSFAGPSGAGKSSLLNAVEPNLSLVTSAVSEKTGRGKQTTRQVELIELGHGGYVADTPGFSQLQLDGIEVQDLGSHFPEIDQRSIGCRFSSCLHRSEPDCSILKAVAVGEIAQSRFDNYLLFLGELEQTRAY